MGRRTVSSVIPAKNVAGKSKDRADNFENNWTDFEHSDNDSDFTTPGPSESPRFRNKNRGRKTGVKALSEKQIRYLDDETEDGNKGKPVIDSAYHTRPSRLIKTSNRTCPSSLKQNIITNEESSDSDRIIDRQISKNLTQEIAKSTSLKGLTRTTKFAENFEIDTSYKSDDNDSDKISLIKEKTNVVQRVSQHLSSKKYSKYKKSNASSSSTTKRKTNVENTENNPGYIEQEFEEHNLDLEMNTPIRRKSKYRSNNLRNLSNIKDNSQQISLRRKLITSYDDYESHSNAAPEIVHANETSNAAINTHQYFPSKKPSKYKNSLKTKRKIHVAENTGMDQEKMSKGRDLGIRRGIRSKKNRNKVVEVPSDQLRRSKRDRIAPLKYWANERRLFRYNNRTGKIKCLGIDPGTGEDDECQRYLKRRQEKYQQAKMKKKNTRKLPLNSKTAVYNKHTRKNERVVLHMPFDNISWELPFGFADNNKEKPDYYLSKPFNSRESMFGFLKIRPNKRKPSQISPVSNIHFLVVKGQVKVSINDSVYELKKMDSFIVPKHQSYSIENLLNSYALLSFCAFKAPFFDYELE